MKPARRSSLSAVAVVAVILMACNESDPQPGLSPAVPIPPGARPSPAPPAPLPTHTLSGRVVESTEQGVRPLADANVSMSLFAPPGVFPHETVLPPVLTDSEGRYRVPDLPHEYSVRLQAGTVYSPGWLHPCGAAATMNSDAVVDIEVVSSPEAARTIRDSPIISGVVYEMSAGGRRPIAGASVGYEGVCWTGEFPNAWTRTDSNGRYELCRLSPPDVLGGGCITAFAGGGSGWSGLLSVRGDMVVDIEVTRPAAHR